MSLFVVDVEADGPIPFDYSMVSFGAVLVEKSLGSTFCGQTRPNSAFRSLESKIPALAGKI